MLRGLRNGLKKTRAGFVQKLDRLFSGRSQLDAQTLEMFEEILVTSDLGLKTTTRLIERMEKAFARSDRDAPQALRNHIREGLGEILGPVEGPLETGGVRPFVVMVIGVNGVGKTTTIAKIGKQWRDKGFRVMFVAADTFRAAAIEQLEIWGGRIGAEVIRQRRGADPSAVVFDALQAAQSRDMDLVLIDTAGRLHTKVNLMDELKKIQRVAGSRLEGAPHEVLLVLDATTGQNALSQSRMFHEAVGVTGIAMTKLDGTAKGGILAAVASELGIPVRYIGIGEGVNDLLVFRAQEFVDALFNEPEGG